MNGVLGTILVLIILLAIVAGIVSHMIRARRDGKSVICGCDCKSCGGCCGSCSACSSCAGRKP